MSICSGSRRFQGSDSPGTSIGFRGSFQEPIEGLVWVEKGLSGFWGLEVMWFRV